MKSDFAGTIMPVRAVEDCIRKTGRYTESFLRQFHPVQPVQGESFPSRVFCKHYEVYPSLDTAVSWDMPVNKALEWVLSDVEVVNVTFWYDYRSNKARVTVHGDEDTVGRLGKTIPGFRGCLSAVTNGEKETCVAAKETQAVGVAPRAGISPTPHPQPLAH